jgi:hypothetical protein
MAYNGWTNYATWRVNLELIDGLNPREMGWRRLSAHDLADTLKDFVDETLFCDAETSLAMDYARAFLSDVNWHEIAENMLEPFADADADEDVTP